MWPYPRATLAFRAAANQGSAVGVRGFTPCGVVWVRKNSIFVLRVYRCCKYMEEYLDRDWVPVLPRCGGNGGVSLSANLGQARLGSGLAKDGRGANPPSVGLGPGIRCMGAICLCFRYVVWNVVRVYLVRMHTDPCFLFSVSFPCVSGTNFLSLVHEVFSVSC